MNARLKVLIDHAEHTLDPSAQDRIVDMLEDFLSMWNDSSDFTPEELAHVTRLESEPFEAASPEAVAAFFGRS